MLVCSSYAEDGKHAKAIRVLNRIAPTVRTATLSEKQRADFLLRMGRLQFFLGRYDEASSLFYDASKSFRELADWESASKAIFNTAAALHNSGSEDKDAAYAMVEESRKLAERHELVGPQSHCEAFYGLDAFQHGDFAASREHFRAALEFLPISDKSYRRLHLLSMLSYVYLATGRFHLARKFGQQTIDLATLDESERNRTRYQTLEAELLWEEGRIDDSQALLKELTRPLESHGVTTLEELATLNRYRLQSAILGDTRDPTSDNLAPHLRKHNFNWLDRVYALGNIDLNRRAYTDASKKFTEIATQAREDGDRLHEALGLLGTLQTSLRQRKLDDLDEPMRDFEVAVAKLGETPLKTHLHFVRAARAYQTGDFRECVRILSAVAKASRQSFPDRFVLGGWIATIEGRSARHTAAWQERLMARYTRTYFAPRIEAVAERTFRVSEHYLVSLERHPSLAELLHFLILKSDYSATSDEVQSQVWKQSLRSQGWQQKIRNTIMRLRDFFPYTVAPLILHTDSIRLFKEAIQVQPMRPKGLSTSDEVLRLLDNSPMSSTQLSNRLNISASTTKRILKKLTEMEAVETIRDGRKISYRAATLN